MRVVLYQPRRDKIDEQRDERVYHDVEYYPRPLRKMSVGEFHRRSEQQIVQRRMDVVLLIPVNRRIVAAFIFGQRDVFLVILSRMPRVEKVVVLYYLDVFVAREPVGIRLVHVYIRFIYPDEYVDRGLHGYKKREQDHDPLFAVFYLSVFHFLPLKSYTSIYFNIYGRIFQYTDVISGRATFLLTIRPKNDILFT